MNTRIDDSLRRATIMDRDGYPYVIHPLMDGVPRVDPSLLIQFAEWACDAPELQGTTVLLAPEAMGIPLAAAISMKTGIPYLVARKRPYHLKGQRTADVATGYGRGRLHINGLEPRDRILLIDDVISTGGTLDGLLQALAEDNVRGVLAFVDKGGHAEALSRRHGVPVRAMRGIRVTAQGVEVHP